MELDVLGIADYDLVPARADSLEAEAALLVGHFDRLLAVEPQRRPQNRLAGHLIHQDPRDHTFLLGPDAGRKPGRQHDNEIKPPVFTERHRCRHYPQGDGIAIKPLQAVAG